MTTTRRRKKPLPYHARVCFICGHVKRMRAHIVIDTTSGKRWVPRGCEGEQDINAADIIACECP